MNNHYTEEELLEKIKRCKVVESVEFKNCLIETFLALPKDKVDHCIENILFLEIDRWGEFHKKLFKEGRDNVILITKETLSIKPPIAKFIVLHEVGHFLMNHNLPMSSQTKREKQDKEADEFAGKYFPDWKRYFIRDQNNNLKLTELGECQKIQKHKLIN